MQRNERGVAVHTQRPVARITRLDTGAYMLLDTEGRQESYDAVLSTVGPGLMAKLAPDLPADYLSSLTSLQSMGAVVLTVALDRQLMREVYWANIPKQEGLPFLALVEHTNMIDPAHYGGDHLLYIGDYLEPDHRYFDLSADELLAEVLPHLAKFNADVPAGVGEGGLDPQGEVCAARAARRLCRHDPRHPHAVARALLRLHEPGLPVGPGNELRRGDRAQRGRQ